MNEMTALAKIIIIIIMLQTIQVQQLKYHFFFQKCQIFLCGTKNDLIKEEGKYRAINYHDVLDYADEIGAKMFETSSKTGEGIGKL